MMKPRRLIHGILLVLGISLLGLVFYYALWLLTDEEIRQQLKSGWPWESWEMLIENAIKHNEHTQAHPLVMDVTVDNGNLCVSNPKRLIQGAESASVGLHNIVERYRLLTRKKVCIEDAPDHYRVTLPLLPAR